MPIYERQSVLLRQLGSTLHIRIEPSSFRCTESTGSCRHLEVRSAGHWSVEEEEDRLEPSHQQTYKITDPTRHTALIWVTAAATDAN